MTTSAPHTGSMAPATGDAQSAQSARPEAVCPESVRPEALRRAYLALVDAAQDTFTHRETWQHLRWRVRGR